MPPLRSTGADREAEEPEYAGAYRLQACLGAGGMGVVHLASSASGLRLAVKVVHGQYAEDPEFRARFRQEVAAARRVSGAFTAPVVDADPDAVRPWMATLYVPGPTLADQVKRNGPLAPAELRRLTAGLAEALRDIHRAGVVHRDLKPSNVLLTDTGPKVIDFGISRPLDSDLHTETGKLIGSPPFMAPEQFQRPREVGPAADVFALGSVLVHAATGHGPFDSDSPYIVAYQVVHDEPDLTGVPAELAPLVARCLAKEPAERPTPAEIMAALLPPSYEAAAFIPAQRRPPTLPPLLPASSGAWDADTPVRAPAPRPRRRLRPLVVAAAALVVLAAGGAWAALGMGDGRAHSTAPRPDAAAAAFTHWETRLQTAGEPVAPACTSTAAALYCSARGVALARLDPVTGRVLWSRPEAVEGLVWAPVPSGGLFSAIAADGTLRAFTADQGAPVWDTSASVSQEGADPAGDTLLFPTSSGAVKAVDGATGKPRWQRALRGFTAPRFGPYDEASGLVPVFETTSDRRRTSLGALRPRTGEILWQQRLEGDLVPVGTNTDGVLFLRSSNADSQTDAVVRYDPSDRSVRRIPLPYRLDGPKIAVWGTAVYLLDASGRLTALDTAAPSGRVLWELETAAGNVSAPVLGPGDRLYLSAADGRLLAVDTVRGALLGQTDPRLGDGRLGYATTVPAPVVAGAGDRPDHVWGRVFGTAPDGSVFAVDGRDPGRW
ncbi:PQQ-binding-like beta-propeller repeat protein [Streptomyces sp. ISL-36]|uniref:serine/threonine-protein kinase n=1 Tax=Streptomyces sp. ISL-36 TaxID=2819182 RepID=UPI001BEAE45F|nr:serine/threonine-protein kinase [Streptomyces sp. ISL-36]MBT2443471.1 PQQ-binding-like beta-propeller repeat protein [Streptomyces sp. ISL-36]